ncbi:F0F1 ATP synthase subunit epsilon [Aestuariivirga litoralis]|uniref:ATP synthase epsilon chain n=1 Tax=Aestuariivirga litoralis TaxID=2650924 RepID=A0A2W2ATX8_9HYPH|nr:F0F1 ATP synthase subunit epsilon [Aestuariivirga litoralis]PZF77152.1 F0F1 ATP synthase subunit epsilon [Aestuariivirga litoralis]
MAGLHFELVSPARLLFSGDVASVTLPGTEGEMGIYPGHSPVLTTLRPGVVTVTRDGGAAERIFVKGGMAEVNPQGLTLLAEVAIPVAEVTADVMARQIKDAEQDLADAKPGEAQRKATEVLNQLKALQSAL